MSRETPQRSALFARFLHIGRLVVVALVAVALVRFVLVDGATMADALRSADPGLVGLAVVAAAAGQVCLWLSWRRLWSAVTGAHLGMRGPGVFFTGQLGKYLPGGVWTVLAHADLGASRHVPRALGGLASAASLLVLLATGGAVGAAAVLGAGPPPALVGAVVVVVVACVVVLVPRVLTAVAERVARRPRGTLSIAGRDVVVAAAWAAAWWCAAGVHAWLLLAALAPVTVHDVPRTAAAFAFAWVAGMVVVVAPAGVGARESLLVVLLAGTAPQATVLTLALLSRAVFVVLDVVCAGLGWLVARTPVRGTVDPVEKGHAVRPSRPAENPSP